MTANPTRNLRKQNQDGSYDTVCLTCFATVGHTISECGKLEHTQIHICDSAFLAERGILTGTDPARIPSRLSHTQTSDAA